ncbi:hypothetical protein BCR42DRAFT_403505 [Absidia repens]|uniref:RNI-like protein n=1 Tax=Absidia repens TaxID=90262 RepID=A0A1X2IZH7_9FUNG|nr:hypothetical protein BCR42DRAFT_403505 [Absidia repens]
MDNTQLTKGILRKPLIMSTSPAQASSSSWLSRIQSRLSTHQQDDDNLELQRHFLKRVTFSMDRLTTEHLFQDDTIDNSDNQQTGSSPSTTLNDYTHLPQCYEKSCRLREEKEWPLFKDMLQTHFSTPLTTIDLSNQSVGPSFIGPFADTLLIDFGLRILRLSNCNLDDASVGTLLNSILMIDRVTELDLSCNSFKSKGYKFISIYIAESRNIKSLDISKGSPDRRATQYLSRALLYSTSLQHLNMDQCALKSTHLEVLAPSVCRSPSLKSLSLRYNRLSSNAAYWLATLILNEQQQYDDMYLETAKDFNMDKINDIEGYPMTTNTGLERLDLAGNPLQDTAIAPLCQALYANRTLKYLSLTNCKVYPNGCEMLADALYTNQCLTSLDLSENPIIHGSDDGIHALKAALLRNNTLQELILINTDLDATAAITLAEVLPMNDSLTRLDLSENPSISLAGVLALSISIKMNNTLTFLDISIPNNDRELANLQNDIAAVCTNNMIQRVEQQRQQQNEEEEHQQQHYDHEQDKQLDLNIVTSSSTTLSSSSSPSSSSSSSSVTSSSSHTSIKENNGQVSDSQNQQKPPTIEIPRNVDGASSFDSSQHHSSNKSSTVPATPDQASPLDEISLLDDM